MYSGPSDCTRHRTQRRRLNLSHRYRTTKQLLLDLGDRTVLEYKLVSCGNRSAEDLSEAAWSREAAGIGARDPSTGLDPATNLVEKTPDVSQPIAFPAVRKALLQV